MKQNRCSTCGELITDSFVAVHRRHEGGSSVMETDRDPFSNNSYGSYDSNKWRHWSERLRDIKQNATPKDSFSSGIILG